ncbi:hypothetical protein [Aeromicrobium sp.]|uniref:hypothetical protein n=1 Tax=Aeromicrobium sp. TaxID=1871063 RepID=UPI002633E74D|nr:hypothetical protein [Aeromicrobium sp.]
MLELSRAGLDEAYAELCDRHSFGARRLASRLGLGTEAEDVVSDCFAQVLNSLRREQGEAEAPEFRRSLFTAIRLEAQRRAGAGERMWVSDASPLATEPSFAIAAAKPDSNGRGNIRAAYETLTQPASRVACG